ncbi:hypothetical protein PCCS19_20900 [Paenibacillus sp. CCS19]|uniref:hypothetical protein n=1 Tax=Paenibacillus sp. CCS19 TaxID=3158387 RepID=UPI00255D1FDD|nr:hypothetical protein [Paenibacillus cellulosilyticus]GMK39036.1 hypothetical protein PCCS19_20900 [Paenibacillus cellulosilyticus]
MRVKNSAMKVLLSTALVASSFAGIIAPTKVQAASAGVGGVNASTGGATSVTAAGDFQTSDRVAVLEVGFIANPDGLLSEVASVDELEDSFKFSHDLEKTMLYISPNKESDNLFRKEGSGLLGYTSEDGILTLYGNNPLYFGSEAILSHSALMNKTLKHADEAKSSSNYFEQVMGKALISIDPDNPSRNLAGSDGSKPVGSTLKSILESYIVKDGQPDIDSQINQSMILSDYLKLIKERKILSGEDFTDFESQLYSAFKANKLTLLFQTVVGISVKDGRGYTSRDFGFMPSHDATAWYLDIQKAAKPTNKTVQNLSANREAEAVTHGGASTSLMGANSPYAENGNLPFSFRTYMRDNYAKTLKPVTEKVTLSDDVSVNPFGGWGIQMWNAGSFANTPAIEAEVKVTVVDKNGNPTGEVFTEPVRGWAEKNKRYLFEMDQTEEFFITDSMMINHAGKTYEILPEESAQFTLVDKKDNENMNKDKLEVAAKGREGFISLPTDASSNTWSIELGYDTPSPLDLNKYLGGDGVSSVENKYADSNGSSNAKLTLLVKAKEDIPGEPIDVKFEVPEWKLSQYWSNISPKETNKSQFALSLPAQTFKNPRLSPSDMLTFGLVDPNATPWGVSRAKLFNDTPTKSITPYSTSASFNETGDFLAVKDNGSVFNTKLADWVNNFSLFTGKIGAGSKGVVDDKSVVYKSQEFKYGVKSSAATFSYSETRWGTACGENGCWSYPYTWSGTASQRTRTADYDVLARFKHYTPSDSKPNKKFDPTSESTNGLYWQSKQSQDSFSVYPEVMMGYDDTSGNTSVAFTAGEKPRAIQAVSYNQAKFIGLEINPSVTGLSTATDSAAKALATRLNSNKDVILKGSATTNSFDVKGELEIKTFALDIGSSAYKNSWNPSSSYNTDAINDSYLAEYATKNEETGKWQVTFDADGKFVIGGKEYGGQASKLTVEEKSTKVVSHVLEVRGGKLIGVDGSRELSALSEDLKNALERMHISTAVNVFSTFESGSGDKLTEAKFASLAAAVRGSIDIAVGKGWYSEDSSLLVVREHVTTFALPSYQYADKLPMEMNSDLATPVDKTKFFSVGLPGFTKLQLKVGNAQMTADSSTGQIGVQQPQFLATNVSVLDTFSNVQ